MKDIGKYATILLIVLFAVVLLKTAWVNDDAYITFRTIDNFINGYGLTWNTAERVQAYTHPLWIFLLSAVYFVTREIYYSSLVVSIIISLVGVSFFAFKVTSSSMMAILGITVLILSKAYMDYSTSGLENPATHLLLIIFLFVYLRSDLNLRTFFWLCLIAGLAALNRMDTLLLYIPALGYAFVTLKNWKAIFIGVAGFLPFVLWELFSVFYYGSFFPNTAYAKLNTNIGAWELTERGLYYLQNSLLIDPLTLLIVATAIIVPFIGKQWRNLPIVAGILLYLIYVVRIGGDFMTGRFLTAPLLAAVILLVDSQLFRLKLVWGFGLTAIILVGLTSAYPPLLSGSDYGLNHGDMDDPRGVTDERAVYYKYTGLFRHNWNIEPPTHPRMAEGIETRRNQQQTAMKGSIGFFGFYAGPEVHIVDRFGLGDPLLARLPPKQNPEWVIGHLQRRLPEGYLDTLSTGKNQIQDENLAAYYDKLSLITAGPLFDPLRLSAIWNGNLGRYDHLVKSYQPPTLQINLAKLEANQNGVALWDQTNTLEQYAAIQINLGGESHARQIAFQVAAPEPEEGTLDFEGAYYLLYMRGETLVGYQELEVPNVTQGETEGSVPVPPEVAQQGYDTIKIVPVKGDNIYGTILRLNSIKLPE